MWSVLKCKLYLYLILYFTASYDAFNVVKTPQNTLQIKLKTYFYI